MTLLILTQRDPSLVSLRTLLLLTCSSQSATLCGMSSHGSSKKMATKQPTRFLTESFHQESAQNNGVALSTAVTQKTSVQHEGLFSFFVDASTFKPSFPITPAFCFFAVSTLSFSFSLRSGTRDLPLVTLHLRRKVARMAPVKQTQTFLVGASALYG